MPSFLSPCRLQPPMYFMEMERRQQHINSKKNLPIASFNTGSMIRICTSAEALKRKDGHICRVRHCAHSGLPFTHTASCLIFIDNIPHEFILYGVLQIYIVRCSYSRNNSCSVLFILCMYCNVLLFIFFVFLVFISIGGLPRTSCNLL